jgi:dTDP-4-dehydrorhamnose 3,5-epimerase
MTLHRIPLSLPGALLFEPEVFADARGFFVESFNRSAWREAGMAVDFVQDNHSRSHKDTVRGMHFTRGEGQAKLVTVVRGAIHDVIVDIRPGSSHFGRHEVVILDDVAHRQLFIPAGFAHGFCVVSDEADVLYKVSRAFDAALEAGFRWDDPELGIDWPVKEPILSERDRNAPSWREVKESLPR